MFHIKWTFFPSPESTSVTANVRFVAGTSDATTNAFLVHLEQSLIETIDELDEEVVETWYVNHRSLGGRLSRTRGDRVGGIYVELTAPDSREVSSTEFVQQWEEKIELPSGVESFTLAGRRTGGSSTDLEVRLVHASPPAASMWALRWKNCRTLGSRLPSRSSAGTPLAMMPFVLLSSMMTRSAIA